MSRSLKADQVADAFTSVPGEQTLIYNEVPSVLSDLGSASVVDIPNLAEVEFFVAVGGLKRLDFNLSIHTPSATGSRTQTDYSAVIDSGGFNGFTEQTIQEVPGPWRIETAHSTAINLITQQHASAVVTLEAGTHRIKFQYETISGNTPRIDTATPFQVWMSSVTGSGASGTIDAEFLFDDGTDHGSIGSSWTQIKNAAGAGSNVEVSVTVQEGERVLITSKVQCYNSSTATINLGVGFDGADPVDPYYHTFSEGNPPNNRVVPLVYLSPALSQGTHTIGLFAKTGAGSLTVRGVASVETVLQATIFRGGLVPIKQDDVSVLDTPRAINAVGPGLQATNVGGQVNLAVNSAAEGIEVTKTSVTNGPTEIPTAAETVLESLDVTVVEGETVLVSFVGTARCDTGGQNCYTHVRLRDGGLTGTLLSDMVLQPFNSGSDNQNASFTYPAVGLSAGTHNLVVTFDSNNTFLQAYYHQLAATQYRGGYVVPENVPQLAYNSASVVDAVAATGAASRLWLLLSDGKRYYADGTQTIDLTASGLGGLDTGTEASSTWYYGYAVPSATSGVFDVVASVTDPDSGGPTGYDAWRWLGAIRNNSSSDIVRFTQVGDWFYMYPWGTENNLVNISSSAPTFNSWPCGRGRCRSGPSLV
jgi:hypothetical protein